MEALQPRRWAALDAILMDVMMPVRDGHEVPAPSAPWTARTQRPSPFCHDANAFTEDRRKALESGMNEHLPKPIDRMPYTACW